jgi:hypothetical protein
MSFVEIPGAWVQNIFLQGGSQRGIAGEGSQAVSGNGERAGSFGGGADQDRTGDLLNAIWPALRLIPVGL